MKQFKKNMGDDDFAYCNADGVPEDFYWPGMNKELCGYEKRKQV